MCLVGPIFVGQNGLAGDPIETQFDQHCFMVSRKQERKKERREERKKERKKRKKERKERKKERRMKNE